MHTYEEQIQKATEILDQVNIKGIYYTFKSIDSDENGMTFDMLMYRVNLYCNAHFSEVLMYDFFKYDIFNQMSPDDFKQYLINRYGKKVMLADITYINF
ncbi:MAG: hypothetical protein [Wendovervirus sonii]|uniref:Uncharacterized protein n=1 Tax=phage Lak_Megaphage_Sonny TaxID=3109229 RepID=A0ABZ0Z2V1_9CAUD|nr:MAG: hypothetical protein [phage Lak_Megaphage_Sonny]